MSKLSPETLLLARILATTHATKTRITRELRRRSARR